MLSLPAIFSDHMVFQREKNILLWGESDEKSRFEPFAVATRQKILRLGN